MEDIDLLAEKENELKNILNRMYIVLRHELGFKINMRKTKVMEISRKITTLDGIELKK